MKMNFKYVSLLACAALMAGFSSCSSDDEVEKNAGGLPLDGVHNVTMEIKAGGSVTRADEIGAVGVYPQIDNMNVFFMDGTGTILSMGYIALTPNVPGVPAGPGATGGSTTQTFSSIPNTATHIRIIGNVGDQTAGLLTGTSTDSDLAQIMYDISAQGGNHMDVSVCGTEYYTPAGTVMNVSMGVAPAVSRLEIAKVEGDNTAVTPNDIISYDLEGIFINNAYDKIGWDYTVYPTALTDLIAYDTETAPGTMNPIWTAGYPTRYSDDALGMNGSLDYAPANIWGYYIASAAQKNASGTYIGNTINGQQYGAVPAIVLKLDNVTTGVGAITNATYGGTLQFVTVTKYKNAADGSYITSFEPGKVYEISNILFDGSHLDDRPMPPLTEHTCVVEVTVKPWESINTIPEL